MISEVTLAQCPIGLFWAGDELCLKTEYGNNDGRIDAYIVSTGEFFWGSHPQTIPNQRMQMVRPVPEEALARFTAYDDMQTEILRLREDIARLEMERTLSGEGDDPHRILKNALFALGKLKAPAMIYGGVLTEGGKHAWLEYSLREQGDYSVFSGEGRSGAGAEKPSDNSDPWYQLGWYKDRLERAEIERDEWKDRAMSSRLSALNARQSSEGERLRPMEEAPKDGTYILAIYKSLNGYALQLEGRVFAVRHEGKTPSDYDLGWALFPGHGGVPDKCFYGWMPIPAALRATDDAGGA